MSFKHLYSLLVLGFTLFGASFIASGQPGSSNAPTVQSEATPPGKEGNKLDVAKVIFGHIADAHEWHLFTVTHPDGEPTHVSLPLPVILYHPQKGFSFFSSSRIADGQSYEGYHLEKGMMKEHIISEDGVGIYDVSITKNVLSMLIGVALLLWIMMKAGKKYNQYGAMKAPSGMQNFIEVIIIFLRDEVARPCLGKSYKKYMPLLLTIFFFIWINNLLGLLPGGANFTGNITATCCLALYL